MKDTHAMMRIRARALTLAMLALSPLSAVAGELVISPVEVVETKAVFGRVEARDVVPARARIGGTLISLDVDEGASVKAGQVIAVVGDDKLSLRLAAIDARIKAVEAERANARTEMDRATSLVARGVGTQQRVDQARTQLDVLSNQLNATMAERAVIVQETSEGQVVAPASGRVLKVPVTRGAVALPGETIATVAGGGFFLRLALPERHAALLTPGSQVQVSAARGSSGHQGKLVKIYPQIENGRVIADVEVEGIEQALVGERVLVHVPIAKRAVIAVPFNSISKHAGIEFVNLAGGQEVAVLTGPTVETPDGAMVEVLSGLKAGDRVLVP